MVIMSALIPPHGGLSEPVCCTVPAEEAESFTAEAASLPQVPVSAADVSTVYRIADGTLSPLTGPMNAEVYNRVLDEGVIERDGRRYAWTIPLSLPVTAEQAGRLSIGEKVALVNPAGEIIGTLDIADIFDWDKPHYLR